MKAKNKVSVFWRSQEFRASIQRNHIVTDSHLIEGIARTGGLSDIKSVTPAFWGAMVSYFFTTHLSKTGGFIENIRSFAGRQKILCISEGKSPSGRRGMP